MKKFLIILSICISTCLCGVLIYFVAVVPSNSAKIERIGIGGGGAFFNPMIDPLNENIYYVTSDMGAIYYSYNKGQTWDRSEARAVFAQTHISNNGVVFAGGNGLCASFDKAKTLNLIYPKDVKYSVSRCGWNENLMLADGYDNGYIKCITSQEDFVFCNNRLGRQTSTFKMRL